MGCLKLNSLSLKQFQEQVSELLLRHRSLLDVLSKMQQSNANVNRSVVKSITDCGCIQVYASKQKYSDSLTLEDAKETLATHVTGHLCEHCREIVIEELGTHLFYMSALSNLLEVNLEQVLATESQKCSTLGLFKLS